MCVCQVCESGKAKVSKERREEKDEEQESEGEEGRWRREREKGKVERGVIFSFFGVWIFVCVWRIRSVSFVWF